MKKFIPIVLLLVLVSSCTVQKPLYSWGKYETTSYNYLKNSDEKSAQALIEDYQNMIENQKGTRNVPPPGVFADYAYVLLQLGKTDEGKSLLMREMELYPESTIFIQRILKMLDQ